MKKLLNIAIGSAFAFSLLFQTTSCDPIEPSVPEPDTTTVILPQWGAELFAQATIAGQTKYWKNASNGMGNGVDSAVYYPCNDQPLGMFESQMTYFSHLDDTNVVDVILFEFVNCVSGLNTEPEQDSIIYPGQIPFGSVDSAYNGIIVTYIDENEKIWSSQLAPEISIDQLNSNCFVSDVVENYESYSKWITAASVNCRLYDSTGAYVDLVDGIFVARIGLYNE